MNLKKGTIFTVLSFGILALIMSTYNSTIQPIFVTTFAQENESENENEAEVKADIKEQENKCAKDTECENENKINNQLQITNNETQSSTSGTSLNVIKTVVCQREVDAGPNPIVTPFPCSEVGIGPEDFTISVTGNGADPSEFQGSSQGTLVTLNAGDYTVTEILNLAILADLSAEFSEDCTQTSDFESQGTIAEGQTQTCNIENTLNFSQD